MRALRLLTGLILAIAFAGCSAPQDTVMPSVLGSQLDVAKSDIKRAGFSGKVEVLGGGILGIIDESNWQVCEQLPTAGQVVRDAPRLRVERECPGAAAQPSSASPVATPSAVVTPSATSSPQAEEPDSAAPEPDRGSGLSATAIEKKFKEHLRNNNVKKIGDMCDEDVTHWSCFYDGVEDGAGYLVVNLTTDGGWSDEALDDLAASAGRHWFNFIGCDFPDLDTIVVTINGLEHNVLRSDTMVDATCGD